MFSIYQATYKKKKKYKKSEGNHIAWKFYF